MLLTSGMHFTGTESRIELNTCVYGFYFQLFDFLITLADMKLSKSSMSIFNKNYKTFTIQ